MPSEGKFAATGARSDKIRESSVRICASIVRIVVREQRRESCGLIESRSDQIGERFEVIIVNFAEIDATCVMIDGTFAGIDVTRGAIDAVVMTGAKLGRMSFSFALSQCIGFYLLMPSSLMNWLSLVMTIPSVTSERQERMGLSFAAVCPLS